MSTPRAASFLFPFLFVACVSHSGESKQDPSPSTAAAAKDEGESKDDAKKAAAQKVKDAEKEWKHKVRDLEYAEISVRTTAIDRQIRTMGFEAELARAEKDVEKHKKNLEQHTKETAPRELEERKIGVDHNVYRAEEAKDELAELESMYKADEFAKATKELVIKRGRRGVEMADRSLAVARRELAELETHTMPQRERELRDQLADAERTLQKARLEADKARIELDVAQRQADDRVADLKQEVEDLVKKLDEAKKEAAKAGASS